MPVFPTLPESICHNRPRKRAAGSDSKAGEARNRSSEPRGLLARPTVLESNRRWTLHHAVVLTRNRKKASGNGGGGLAQMILRETTGRRA
jgi:hypothetical protein